MTEIDTAPAVQLGTAVLVGQFEDGSPEWHAQRRNVIGGSEIGSILGVNNFQSRYVLWYSKAGFLDREEGEVNPLFEWGHRLEEPVAQKFADNHPEFTVSKSGSFIHQDRPWHGANPDRILSPAPVEYVDEFGVLTEYELPPEAVLEIKTSMNGYGWENDMCPIKYVGQLRWYLECFGFDYGYLVVLANLGDYREFLVPRDPEKPVISGQTGKAEWYAIGGQEMIEAGWEFYQSLPGRLTAEGTPPDIDGGKDSYELIRTFHPDINNKEVEIPLEIALQLDAAVKADAETTAELQRMKSVLLDAMGNDRVAVCGGRKIARRQSKGGGNPFLVLL